MAMLDFKSRKYTTVAARRETKDGKKSAINAI